MKKIFLLIAIVINLLVADNILLEKAQKANLLPIPSSTSELLKLIDEPQNPITDAKIELGKKLFFDPRLSKSNLISCNTCHNLGLAGVDGVSTAIGDNWQANPQHLNSPTVYNSVFLTFQFWDGRSPHLADQAKGPLTAPFEMASKPEDLAKKISSIKGYQELFDQTYGQNTQITFELIADTIAIFEKTLVTPSKFDKFLEGDMDILSEKEKKGLHTFIDKRCVSCHNGVALGGMMKYFVMKNFTYKDIGSFSGNDNFLVKVPTLRNISKTAPYFHNGSVWSLNEAVLEMARIQLKLKITDEEAQSIVDFLKSLDGDMPNITYPTLPY
ncbi:MAG: cytochrome-c peroxidase [Arcobacteraceae bacterium]|jgi:cytochrome c peroxidase|nr:cytochrome-c peroxidase [Arcobacteraceae bacterium]MDY0327863.1 cytochrome-c peroxidase [Arcobacteraceae bacterium]